VNVIITVLFSALYIISGDAMFAPLYVLVTVFNKYLENVLQCSIIILKLTGSYVLF